MKKFVKISHSNGQDAKVILANNRYQAVGFYLWEEVLTVAAESLDRVEILPADYIVHPPTADNRTLEQIWQEQDDWLTFPKTIVNLPEKRSESL